MVNTEQTGQPRRVIDHFGSHSSR